jgi:hypothetical protein
VGDANRRAHRDDRARARRRPPAQLSDPNLFDFLALGARGDALPDAHAWLAGRAARERHRRLIPDDAIPGHRPRPFCRRATRLQRNDNPDGPMFFRNLTLFRFPTTAKLDDLDRGLDECQLKPVGPAELSRPGFISPFGIATATCSPRASAMRSG